MYSTSHLYYSLIVVYCSTHLNHLASPHDLYNLSYHVDYAKICRDARTTEAVDWYKRLNRSRLPYLICLTHGDRLFDECKCTDDEDLETKAAIRKQIKVQKAW